MASKRTRPPPPSRRRARPTTVAAAGKTVSSPQRDFGIVGVGASAGGLEAFKDVLSRLPQELPLAFVLVPHLDPTRASELVEILSRVTSLKVVEATDGMTAEPGRVVVIPPNASLTITHNVLRVAQRRPDHDGHRPIDHFLRSLADDAGGRAIGVILSGSLSDGALGIAAIKAAGGLTLVQDPASAKHDSMPRSAIASGAVDFVLPPEGIARELARIGVHLGRDRDGQHTAPPDEERALQAILHMLRADGGIDFSQYRQTTMRRRIARRMLVHRLTTLQAYRQHLKNNGEQLRALSEDLLIDVTRFFRDPEAFAALQRRVFPGLVKNAASHDQAIRCWAPGCASGEETYSLAIALLEVLGEKGTHAPIQLFGSDASEKAVDKARRGIYPKNIETDVSAERLRHFFVKTDDQYQVRKTVRELCVFAKHDVLADPPFSNVDLIACRNLLIYLEPPAQRRVMQTLHYALKNHGILLLGGSETLGAFADLFDVIDEKHRIYAKKATSVRLDLGALHVSRDAPPVPSTTRASERLRARGETSDAVHLQREVDRILLGRYAPAAVLVNDVLDVLQFRGHTGAFLEPASGHASFSVLRMAREGLLMPLRTTIEAARKRKAVARREGINVRQDGTFVRINLEVVPVGDASGGRNYLVLFEEPQASRAATGGTARRGVPSKARPSEVEHEALRQELTSTKEFLQTLIEEREAANEELRSANEELLSSNEELQSTNEELQTAKEELQSSNEEIHTVNDELQHRNAELTQLNDDLTNVLTSVSLPMVIVDGACAIRRFTPRAGTLFNLTTADLGRSLRTINPTVEIKDLFELCTSVIDSAMPAQREVRDRDGRWWNLSVRPYRTTENRITGAVIALADVTVLKGKLDEAMLAREFAESVVNTIRSPFLVLNADLCVLAASPSFYTTFKVDPNATVGEYVYDLGNKQWDIPDLRRALGRVVELNVPVTDFTVAHEFQTLGHRTMLLNADQIFWKERSTGTVLLSIEDVTGQRGAERVGSYPR